MDRSVGWLTRTEVGVAELVAEGLTNREIGRRLHIEESTVRWHLKNIFRKLGVKTRTELTRRWILTEMSGDTPHL